MGTIFRKGYTSLSQYKKVRRFACFRFVPGVCKENIILADIGVEKAWASTIFQ